MSCPSASCPSYTNKSEPWRNVGFCSTFCNNTDIKLKEGWYRFIGIGGDQVISSCARAQNNTAGNITDYNLFTCNSNINYTDYITCSQGFTVYYLRPTKRTYATREKNFDYANKTTTINVFYIFCILTYLLVV